MKGSKEGRRFIDYAREIYVTHVRKRAGIGARQPTSDNEILLSIKRAEQRFPIYVTNSVLSPTLGAMNPGSNITINKEEIERKEDKQAVEISTLDLAIGNAYQFADENNLGIYIVKNTVGFREGSSEGVRIYDRNISVRLPFNQSDLQDQDTLVERMRDVLECWNDIKDEYHGKSKENYRSFN